MSAVPRRLGRVVVLSERRTERASVDPALSGAIGGRSIGVHFQPILARPHGRGVWRVHGVEALVRAWSARGVPLRPDRFLPGIARAGLLDRLFWFVLAESVATLRRWDAEGLRLALSVNLHAGALQDDRFPALLAEFLDAACVDPRRLTLELVETAPIADLRRAGANLRRLRAAGVRAALDDFGAGFSTPMRLQHLECDELKIDRELVRGLEQSDEQRCVVESLVGLAHARGIEVCAEGVETAAALHLVEMYGVERVQGFHVARAVDAAELPAVAAGWRARAITVVEAPDAQLTLPGLGGFGWVEA